MATTKQCIRAFTLIRQRGKFLGYVEAPDQETSIKEAIKHFEISDPEQQKRLVAQRPARKSSARDHPQEGHAVVPFPTAAFFKNIDQAQWRAKKGVLSMLVIG
jgi:hypothetical protein